MISEPSYVAVVDILGSRDQLLRDIAGYVQRFDDFLRLVQDAKEDIKTKIGFHADLEVRAFQDTIVMRWRRAFSEHSDVEFSELSNIAHILAYMVAVGLERGLPLRGAIAAGQTVSSPAGVFGTCIAEADNWHKRSKWIGIVFAPSAATIIRDSPVIAKLARLALSFPQEIQSARGLLIECKAPIQTEVRNKLHSVRRWRRYVLHGRPDSIRRLCVWAVDWPRYVAEQIIVNVQGGDPHSLVSQYLETALGRLPSPSHDAKVKQYNSRQFVDFSLRQVGISLHQQQALNWGRAVRKEIKD